MDTQDWQEQLIALYCFVSEQYREHLWMHVERLSPNCHPRFLDEEVLTVYLFGLLREVQSLKAIYRYTHAHLGEWFPALPSYSAFVQRLGRLDAALPALVRSVVERLPQSEATKVYLIDSMPILLAQGVRADRAHVAAGIADLGYCASKKTYYYGIKLHVVALHAPHALPRPECVFFSAASASDLVVAKSYSGALPPGELYADKIYHDRPWKRELRERGAIELCASIRRVRGQEMLPAAEGLYNAAISRVRQPIESLFAWLQQKTQIQNASRVRSTSGLWVHAFGRLAAALLPLCLNP